MHASSPKNADEKDLKIYELELYVKDLQMDLRELSDAKEKLLVANRNARILEEENSNLQRAMKTAENGGLMKPVVPQREEARKLIQENRDLSEALSKSRSETQQAQAKMAELEKAVRNQVEEMDRFGKEASRKDKELESARRLCMQLQQHLDAERETANAERSLWEQEREQLSKKADDAAGTKRHESNAPSNEKVLRSRTGASTLQEKLLKEEVEELEAKLRDTQQELWEKEKEWLIKERDFCEQIKTLDDRAAQGAGEDKGLFTSLQEQIAALKQEINVLRKERRSSRVLAAGPIAAGAPTDSATTTLDLSRGVKPLSPGPDSRNVNAQMDRITKQLDAALKENASLAEHRDELNAQAISLKAKSDEKELKCRELEALLCASQAHGKAVALPGLPRPDGSALNSTEKAELQERIQELESEVDRLRASADQSKALVGVKVRGYQDQIDDLLQENENLRHTNSGSGVLSTQALALTSAGRLSKDKRDSVEDVLRLLEAAWDGEEEVKRQLRKANWSGAALANHHAAKDDEIARLQRLVDDLQDQLREVHRERDTSGRFANENSDALQKLAKELRQLQDECAGLRDALERRNAVTKKLERDNSDLTKKLADAMRNEKAKMRELQDENDRLRRFSERHDPPRQSATPRQSITPRQTRSPRVSARAPMAADVPLTPRSIEEPRRSAVPEGAHLVVSVVELSDLRRGGQPITEPGYVIIKLKSIKEKYKTSVKELTSVIRFDESFVFYLAQPDQDVITLHVYYKPKNAKEYHVGDACFSMATLYRGVTRQRIAPVVQKPGTKEAERAAQIEVSLQTDDFGKMPAPTATEVQQETQRFNDLAHKFETSVPEKLHAVDVYMASTELK